MAPRAGGGALAAAGDVGDWGQRALGAHTPGTSVFDLVGQANPYVTERFERATKDLAALVGRELVPVVESLTARVRGVADVVANLDDAEKGLITAYGKAALATAAFGGGLLALERTLNVVGKHPLLTALTVGAGVVFAENARAEAVEAEVKAHEAATARVKAGKATPIDLAFAAEDTQAARAALPHERAGEAARVLRDLEARQAAAIKELGGFVGEGSDEMKAIRAGSFAALERVGDLLKGVGVGQGGTGPVALTRQIAADEHRIAVVRAEFNAAMKEEFKALEGLTPDEVRAKGRAEFEATYEAEKAKARVEAGLPPAGPGAMAKPAEALKGGAAAGGRGGWGLLGDLLNAAVTGQGPGGKTSRGAAYDPTAGVTDIDAAFRDLVSQGLKLGTAALSRDELLEQNNRLLEENNKLMARDQAPPPAMPGVPEGRPMRAR
jgi:hypothetical protein